MEKTTVEPLVRPTLSNGKICYLEIPAFDIEKSALFFKVCFGWNIRVNSKGTLSFDDTVGEVSGTWVKDRKPISEAGIVISIMVNDLDAAIDLVTSNGGTIVQPRGANPTELTAWFTDPAGNLFGLYQEPD